MIIAYAHRLSLKSRLCKEVAWSRRAARFGWGALLLSHAIRMGAAEAQLQLSLTPTNAVLQVHGTSKEEWRFQSSQDLRTWTNVPTLGSVFSGSTNAPLIPVATSTETYRFLRAVKTDGLFDTNLLRTISLTFTNSNWATLLAAARTTGGNVPARLTLDNGEAVTNVGARYKGNSSYRLGGTKKSINVDINYAEQEARLLGYRAINLNNAAGDSTIMREPLYFNVMREYAPCPHGAMAKLNINGAYWGVYSMVDQNNNDLLDEWFPSHEGDRWRAPNAAGAIGDGGLGGGGGFQSALSAFSYLGPNVSSYTRNYELKSDNSTNAWTRLVHAIDVLNNTPANELRDKVEDVFAVDRWLWFLVVENLFVDDDSYWNKGADYAFYYEPESGLIHPVEHDGNEAFTAAMGINYNLSPLQGLSGTNRPLISKLLALPELRQRYLAHMRTVMEERFNPTFLTPAIEHFRYLTAADIAADPKKNFTMTTYTNGLVALKTYLTNRYNFLTNFAELRPQPPAIVAVYGPSTEPGPAEVPNITAQVEANSNDGVDSVWLYWRDKPYGRFDRREMFDDGAHQDGAANDGLFGAAATNHPAGNKIHYYIEARSGNAAKTAAFSPPRAEQQTFTYRVGLATATNTPVVINEWMAENAHTIADPQGDFDDWIELRNLTDQEVDLTGLYLTDTPANPRKWPFPAGTIVPAAGYLIIWADEAASALPGLHANFKLEKSGEQVLLIDTDRNLNAVLDFVTFGPQSEDRSFGRSADDADIFVTLQPTPGQPNRAF